MSDKSLNILDQFAAEYFEENEDDAEVTENERSGKVFISGILRPGCSKLEREYPFINIPIDSVIADCKMKKKMQRLSDEGNKVSLYQLKKEKKLSGRYSEQSPFIYDSLLGDLLGFQERSFNLASFRNVMHEPLLLLFLITDWKSIDGEYPGKWFLIILRRAVESFNNNEKMDFSDSEISRFVREVLHVKYGDFRDDIFANRNLGCQYSLLDEPDEELIRMQNKEHDENVAEYNKLLLLAAKITEKYSINDGKADINKNNNADLQIGFPKYLSPIIAALYEMKPEDNIFTTANFSLRKGTIESFKIKTDAKHQKVSQNALDTYSKARTYMLHQNETEDLVSDSELLLKYESMIIAVIDRISRYGGTRKKDEACCLYYQVESMLKVQFISNATELILDKAKDEEGFKKILRSGLGRILRRLANECDNFTGIALLNNVINKYFEQFDENTDNKFSYNISMLLNDYEVLEHYVYAHPKIRDVSDSKDINEPLEAIYKRVDHIEEWKGSLRSGERETNKTHMKRIKEDVERFWLDTDKLEQRIKKWVIQEVLFDTRNHSISFEK